MSIDLTLLRILKHRDRYELYHRSVPKELLEGHTRILLDDYGKFFAESEASTADLEGFLPWFLLAHPKLKDEAKSVLTAIIKQAQAPVPEGVEAGILTRLEAHRQVAGMTNLIERYNAGDEVDVIQALRQMADSIPVSASDMPYVIPDIDALLDEEANDWGFHWRLSCLNQSMRPLRPGDFGILAMRVDTGKTTLIASETSFMAPQVDQLFPGEDRCILILNNEGPGRRINGRLVQATLNATVPDMVQMRQQGKHPWDETIKAWGGRPVIKVMDVHDKPLSRLEDIIRRNRPAIVVTDMLDVVPFDGGVNNGGTRTDQILEAAYQRARLWAVKYDCVSLAASQLSADAAGNLYPGLHTLANSRTGKAGAADFVLIAGASDDPVMKNSRFIGLPKNKLARAGYPKDPRVEVRFDGDRARFVDPETMP